MTTAVPEQLDVLFRHQAGRLTAALVRVLGVGRLDVAEDIVQETLLAALQAWQHGLPREPEAWLFAVARNRARDRFRRDRVRRTSDDGGDDALVLLEAPVPVDADGDLLRLMFSCCHPAITEDGQTALILRLVCGFGTREVAHAFLVDPAAMERRLVRGKRVLAAEPGLFEVDTDAAARARVPAVLAALYLMFDAGYHRSVGPDAIRAEICADALRLAVLLADRPARASPELHALIALMALHAARLPARLDAAGELVALERQDRAAWDGTLIAFGMAHLSASAAGPALSAFHLEAGIAAEHAVATTFAATDWPEIARLYELLHAVKPTPIVALGRAIARAQLVGPERGLAEVRALPGLASYPFWWAALADLALRAGSLFEARGFLAQGAAVARTPAERTMFERRLAECEAATAEPAPASGRR